MIIAVSDLEFNITSGLMLLPFFKYQKQSPDREVYFIETKSMTTASQDIFFFLVEKFYNTPWNEELEYLSSYNQMGQRSGDITPFTLGGCFGIFEDQQAQICR